MPTCMVLWSPTGGLFMLAASIIIAAATLSAFLTPARYQFLPFENLSTLVWRGDTFTGHLEVCAADYQFDDVKKRFPFLRRC